ncbi:hypothetical protein [Streptomyces sp. 049-1]|uniref:hypothetical protein n=1 Tax=Streptomyces sp. 049-1 TaxID=2789264 RepID=UPI0039800B2F
MKIERGSAINISACAPDWAVTFDLGLETGPITCPVIGWATVVEAHMVDGTTSTAIEPAFLWSDTVWTPTELREHTPGLGNVEIRAREITRA